MKARGADYKLAARHAGLPESALATRSPLRFARARYGGADPVRPRPRPARTRYFQQRGHDALSAPVALAESRFIKVILEVRSYLMATKMKQSKPTSKRRSADGTVSSYFYPEHGISIVRKIKQRRNKKLAEQNRE